MPTNNHSEAKSEVSNANVKKIDNLTRNKITEKATYELRGLKLLRKIRKASGVVRFHVKTFKKLADAEKALKEASK